MRDVRLSDLLSLAESLEESLVLSLDTPKGLILLDGYMSNRTAQLSVVVQGAALIRYLPAPLLSATMAE